MGYKDSNNSYRIVGNVVGLIVCLALSAGLYRNFTQVHIRLINQSGRKLSDIQIFKKPDHYYAGALPAGESRAISLPAAGANLLRVTFVPDRQRRRYYACPEYLFAGVRAEWVVTRDCKIVGRTAVVPFLWRDDGRPFAAATRLAQ